MKAKVKKLMMDDEIPDFVLKSKYRDDLSQALRDRGIGISKATIRKDMSVAELQECSVAEIDEFLRLNEPSKNDNSESEPEWIIKLNAAIPVLFFLTMLFLTFAR